MQVMNKALESLSVLELYVHCEYPRGCRAVVAVSLCCMVCVRAALDCSVLAR